MWPFTRKVEEPVDEDEVSEADTKAAMFIQQKTQVGSMFANRLPDPDEDYAKQRAHYESVRNDLIGWLDTIEDEFSRGFASHCLIKMCLDGNDEAIARGILAGVRDEFIREKILVECPSLKVDWRTTA